MTWNEQQQLELVITILKGIINNQPNYTNTITSTTTTTEYPNSTGTSDKQNYTKVTS